MDMVGMNIMNSTVILEDPNFSKPIVSGQRSPSLYQLPEKDGKQVPIRPTSLKGSGGNVSGIQRRAAAAKLLRDMEEHSRMEDTENDFGVNWNEESFHLTLFEELADVGFTTPTPSTPASDEFENCQHQLSELSDSTILFDDEQSAEFPESYNQLSANLQNILDSFPSTIEDEIKKVGKICGIPIIQLEEVDEENVEAGTEDGSDDESQSRSDTESQSDPNYMDESSGDEDDLTGVFTPQELAECGIDGDASSQMILIEVDEDILDLSMLKYSKASEEIVNTSIKEDRRRSQKTRIQNLVASTTVAGLRNAFSSSKERLSKPAKSVRNSTKGRKRTRDNRKNNSRIKAQNRNAATRYRQKKKLECVKTKEAEQEIDNENRILQLQHDDLRKQIILVKQLLNSVFQSKKLHARTSNSVPTKGNK